jgi:hypothetical protein
VVVFASLVCGSDASFKSGILKDQELRHVLVVLAVKSLSTLR